MLFVLHIRGFKPLLVFYFRVDEKFAGGKFREIPFAVDIIFAGGQFRAKSKFAKIAKINSTRKIGVIPYIDWTEHLQHPLILTHPFSHTHVDNGFPTFAMIT